jgi:hypothetical protein
MSWQTLLVGRHVAAEPTDKQEIDELHSKTILQLKDAQVSGISAQGRYEFAYNAARLAATVVIRACGYRVVSRSGHHYYTFKALETADPAFARIAANFDAARSKRNDFSYDSPCEITDTDADDLVELVKLFQKQVEKWIAARNSSLA